MTFNPGFNQQEAASLLSLLAKLEGPSPPPLQQPPPLPGNWDIVYDSGSIGPFDNRWQLASYNGGECYAILIRGTVNEPGSIIADLLSVMIQANGTVGLTIDGVNSDYNYQFTATGSTNASPVAGVHLGFSLSAFILMFYPISGILWQLPLFLPKETTSSVFIAGHSQGAAIATLATSFLHYSNNWKWFQDHLFYNYANDYKTYVFAQPKPGNDLYGYDYDEIAGNKGLAFTVNNSLDWVPQVPLTLEWISDVNTPNPISVEEMSDPAAVSLSHDLRHLRQHAAERALAKETPKLNTLRNIMSDERFQRAAFPDRPVRTLSASDKITVPSILPTLNFVGCGSPYILPGVPGVNPCNAGDYWWQHHCPMYYDLLLRTPIPSKC